MVRCIVFFLIISSSISFAYAEKSISHLTIARDLHQILITRDRMTTSVGSGTIHALVAERYFAYLDTFARQYSAPFRVFALRPTVDRSLLYRLAIQQYRLSCEIAALRIILDQFDISVTESDIFAQIPQYPSVYSGGIWGDPDREFVGYYTGGQTQKTGYGIYEQPLADYVETLGLDAEIIRRDLYASGFTPRDHLEYILIQLDKKDTHIMLWADWCTTSSSDDGIFLRGGKQILRFFPLPARNPCTRSVDDRMLIWQTNQGKIIQGISGEHAFVLLGYIGLRDHPTHIIVWDTYTGRHVYPISEWMRKWSALEYRTLIIRR